MAQPLKDHEYNPRDEKPVIGPEPLSGNAKPKSVSAKDLDSAERAPLRGIDGGGEGDGRPDGDLSAVDDKEQALFGGSGSKASGWYKGDEKPGFIKGLFGSFKVKINKKNTSIALATGGILGGGLVGLSVIQGPLQLIHLGQIVQKNLSHQEKSVSVRTNGLLRYYKTGDPGETRVGKMGSITAKKIISELENNGVKFQKTARTGNIKSMTIDTSKHPEFRGMPEDRAKVAIAKRYGIPADAIVKISGSRPGGVTFGVNARDYDPKKIKALVGTSYESLSNGKIQTALQTRVLNRFYNIAGLWSPLKKIARKYEIKKERLDLEKERAEKMRQQFDESPTGTKGKQAKEKLKRKLRTSGKSIGGALLLSEGVCLVKSVSEAIVDSNRAIASASAMEAADKMAIGSQNQAGTNVNLAASGSVVSSFEDKNGKTIWAGKALQAASGKSDPSGEDIPDNFKQAFSVNTTAEKLGNAVDFPGSDTLCSPVGQVIQTLAGVGLLLTGPGGWAANVAKSGASSAATAGAVYMLQKMVVNDAEIPAPLAGPLGGNLLAYGGREMGNTAARASGGIELSQTESARIDYQQIIEDREEFRSKNFFARVFDIYDHRSLASRIIDESSTSPTQNISNVASGLLNIGSIFGRTFSALMPKASAATSNYDWGFPRYDIPQKLLDDENYADPYENADKAADILSGTGDKYIKKAKKCFGAEISKTEGVWTAIIKEEVNPNHKDYIDAKCDKLTNEWSRILLFVADSRNVDSFGCFVLDDDEACANLGLTSQSSDTNSQDSSLAGGDAQELASKILDSGKVAGDSRYMGQIRAVAKGDDSCHVNPTILQLIATIIEKGYSINVSSLNRKCTGVLTASGEASYHYADGGGHAVDISIINGKATTGRDTNAQKLLRDIMPALPKGTGIGQSNCSGDITLLDGITEFSDSCNHLHIQVPKK